MSERETNGEQEDFREVPHFGGIVTVNIKKAQDGSISFSQGFRTKRGGGPWRVTPISVLPQGIPIGVANLSWAPDRANAAPAEAETWMAFLGSDKEGFSGHSCPRCKGYWRGRAEAASEGFTCPYCGLVGPLIEFLTDGQRQFISFTCSAVHDAVASQREGEHAVDLDAISDEVAKGAQPPPFYYTEKKQQHRITCGRCRSVTDILGKYGYCFVCGVRANLAILSGELRALRTNLDSGQAPSDALRAGVSAFDSSCRNLVEQLGRRAPMTKQRRIASAKIQFHDPAKFNEALREIFDIDLVRWSKEEDQNFLRMMFARRHVYEHAGGVADEKYLRESGDATVQLGALIRETRGNVLRFVAMLERMMEHFHDSFHEILPPRAGPPATMAAT